MSVRPSDDGNYVNNYVNTVADHVHQTRLNK